MASKKPAVKAPTKSTAAKSSKKNDEAIALNKPPNEEGKARAEKTRNAPSNSSPQPTKSPGKQVFCRHSLRPSEIFEAKDVVFFREGPAASLQPIPRHEADTRFAAVLKADSSEFNKATGIGTTVLDLEGGDKVTIAGDKVIVTPKEGPATTEGPSLNLHHADVQG